MSKFYGVITTGRGDRDTNVMRASRAGDDYMTAEVSTEDTTYRLSLYDTGEVYLDKIRKRWQEAQVYDEEDWTELYRQELPIPADQALTVVHPYAGIGDEDD